MSTLIILHGWQSSKEKWQLVKQALEKQGFEVIAPDLPGFKPETALSTPWTLNDYVAWLKKFTERACPERAKRAKGFFLLGHSFGARITIKFAEKYPEMLKGLILVSAAGIKNKSFSTKAFRKGAEIIKKLNIEEMPFAKGLWQFFKKFFYRFILRKTDYFKASPVLKQTVKNALEEDLSPLLEKISVPTLIIWGKNDKITPLKHAYLMKEKINNSQIVILDKIGHTPHLENPEGLVDKIVKFLIANS